MPGFYNASVLFPTKTKGFVEYYLVTIKSMLRKINYIS